MSKIGVIGGSGLYELEGIKKIDQIELATPFGPTSAPFVIAELEGSEVVFLPRHGQHHQISPSSINYRANIYGMKKLGVERIISVSACGSLKEEFKPLDFVICDQFVDRTNQARKYTFFDQGLVAHISFAHPICSHLAQELKKAAQKVKVTAHCGGTYLNMEGPQFSTLAESNLYRSWGMDIIGMTNMVEARLSREAEICYVSLAAVTDYDCWHPDHDSVTLEVILNNLKANVDNSKKVLREFILLLGEQRPCTCAGALQSAIITRGEFIPAETKEKLDIIIGKYIK